MRRAGFSMIELVIVVVIVGIVAAIAAPRFNGMAERARTSRVAADLNTLQKASDLYTAEHLGKNPGLDTKCAPVGSGVLAARLTTNTDERGTVMTGIFGPYLREIPTNELNGLSTIRVNGAAPGAGTHGWRYDTAAGAFASDTAFEASLPDGSVVNHLGQVVKAPDLNQAVGI